MPLRVAVRDAEPRALWLPLTDTRWLRVPPRGMLMLRDKVRLSASAPLFRPSPKE
ncbi:hypothetical protein D3C72_2552650 [compost metagenome]